MQIGIIAVIASLITLTSCKETFEVELFDFENNECRVLTIEDDKTFFENKSYECMNDLDDKFSLGKHETKCLLAYINKKSLPDTCKDLKQEE